MIPKNYYKQPKPAVRRKRWTQLSPDKHEAVIALRRQGFLLKEISKQFDISTTAVKMICEKYNAVPERKIIPKYIFWFKERKEELAMMWNRGDAISDIASHFGKTESAINSQLSVLKTEGYKIRLRNNTIRYTMPSGVYINGKKVSDI